MTSRLDLWSRRKAAVAAEEDAARAALEAEERAAREAALAEKPEAEVLADLDLPDPDTLGPGDDFTAFIDSAVHDCGHTCFFAVKALCGTGELETFVAGDFCNSAFRCKIAAQDDEVTIFLNGIAQRANDLLSFWVVFNLAQVLSHRLPGDRQAITVEKPFVEERFHERLNAADFDELAHRVLTSGAHVCEYRYTFADFAEIVELKRDACRMGDRK